jgi:hypothetical protein
VVLTLIVLFSALIGWAAGSNGDSLIDALDICTNLATQVFRFHFSKNDTVWSSLLSEFTDILHRRVLFLNTPGEDSLRHLRGMAETLPQVHARSARPILRYPLFGPG